MQNSVIDKREWRRESRSKFPWKSRKQRFGVLSSRKFWSIQAQMESLLCCNSSCAVHGIEREWIELYISSLIFPLDMTQVTSSEKEGEQALVPVGSTYNHPWVKQALIHFMMSGLRINFGAKEHVRLNQIALLYQWRLSILSFTVEGM